MAHHNLLAKKQSAYENYDKKKFIKMEYIRTPQEIWHELSQEFQFTVDACASDKNHLVDKYWTKERSALDQNWDNEIVYCHPMYNSSIPKFVAKAFNSKCMTVFLLPSGTNAKYFHKYFWCNKYHKPKDRVQIRFLIKTDHLNGFKMATDDGVMPERGYLRPLMIVIVDNREYNGKGLPS